MTRSIPLSLGFVGLALLHPAAAQAGAAFASKRITGKTPGHAVAIVADIRGAKQLYLVVSDGGDGNACDWADWAEPRLVDANGRETRLTGLPWKSAQSDWRTVQIGKSAGGGALRIAGARVSYGLGTHSNSSIVYDLPAGHAFVEFRARGGLDDGGTDQQGGAVSSVRFLVFNRPPSKKFLRRHGFADPGLDHVPLDYFTAAQGLEVTLWVPTSRYVRGTQTSFWPMATQLR